MFSDRMRGLELHPHTWSRTASACMVPGRSGMRGPDRSDMRGLDRIGMRGPHRTGVCGPVALPYVVSDRFLSVVQGCRVFAVRTVVARVWSQTYICMRSPAAQWHA